MSTRMRTAGLLGGSTLLALILTIGGGRLAASQTPVLTAMRTEDTVPVRDPWAPFWNRIPKLDVPLSAQQITPPMGGHRWTVSARAVQDGSDLYVELEWADPRPDRSVAAPQLFSDAAAVQFPGVAGTTVPALCMGAANATVNIWQWKAAWQVDVHRGYQGSVEHRYPRTDVDGYPFHDDPTFQTGRAVGNPLSVAHRTSPVDNLVAGGFGSLTADPTPIVNGWGAWRDGRWRVVFQRPLAVGRAGNVELNANDWTDLAFAVWDGQAQERNGMKSVGNFVALDISPQLISRGARFPYWPAPFFVFLAAWGGFVWLIVGWKPWLRDPT